MHQTAGFYSLLILLAVLMSGVYFNLPEQFRWLVERFSPLTPQTKATTSPSTAPVILETTLQQVRQNYSGGSLDYYSLSGGKQGLLTTCFRDVPELKVHVMNNRCFVISRVDGKLLQIIDAAHGSYGDVFMQWQWPLHSGQAFGWTGRILVFLSGLVCPVLFVTGVMRWLQKRQAKIKSKNMRRAAIS